METRCRTPTRAAPIKNRERRGMQQQSNMYGDAHCVDCLEHEEPIPRSERRLIGRLHPSCEDNWVIKQRSTTSWKVDPHVRPMRIPSIRCLCPHRAQLTQAARMLLLTGWWPLGLWCSVCRIQIGHQVLPRPLPHPVPFLAPLHHVTYPG
jgi:hypothetical protein